MNSYLYDDGCNDADTGFTGCQHISHDYYWDEMFEIEQDLKNQRFHK